MLNNLWPIFIVVAANCLYHISSNSTPSSVNSFASLFVTYGVAAIVAAVLFFATASQKNLIAEIAKTNWSSIVLGLSIVALEFGYINAYRIGWKISVASVIANILLASVLLVVGLLLYKESISLRQVLGVVICAVGLILINK